jgi:hypothetical protein
MTKTLGVAAAFARALVLGACFQHTFTVGSGAPDGEIVYKQWHHHWLFGLIRPKLQRDVTLARFCPSGNATIHEETSFVNGLIDILIGVIYAPTTVTIRCSDGETAQIELSADEVFFLTHDPSFLEVVAVVAPVRYEEVRISLATSPSGPQPAVAAR